MISNTFLRTMSRYNRWQNSALFSAADNLDDAMRREERGAFWKSIHGTLSHIYWADCIWMSRFDLVDAPGVPQAKSASFVQDWDQLRQKRQELDDVLVSWCDQYEHGLIRGKLSWFSGSVQRDVDAPLSVVFVHFFNHQTHHRGQAHALVTAAGQKTVDTDLFLMPEALWPPSETTF